MTSTDSSHKPERLFLHPHPSQIARPLPFFHPTHALFVPSEASQPGELTNSTHWSSRASRKNRYTPKHVPLQRYQDASKPTEEKLQKHHTVMLTEKRLRHPHTMLKVHLTWDVSFWVAVAFVVGSAAWVRSLPLVPHRSRLTTPTPADMQRASAVHPALPYTLPSAQERRRLARVRRRHILRGRRVPDVRRESAREHRACRAVRRVPQSSCAAWWRSGEA